MTGEGWAGQGVLKSRNLFMSMRSEPVSDLVPPHAKLHDRFVGDEIFGIRDNSAGAASTRLPRWCPEIELGFPVVVIRADLSVEMGL